MIHIGVKREFAFLNKVKRTHSGNGFADRSRVKESIRCNRGSSGLFHAAATRPCNLSLMNHGDTNSIDMHLGHAILERSARRGIALYNDWRRQASLDFLDKFLR